MSDDVQDEGEGGGGARGDDEGGGDEATELILPLRLKVRPMGTLQCGFSDRKGGLYIWHVQITSLVLYVHFKCTKCTLRGFFENLFV